MAGQEVLVVKSGDSPSALVVESSYGADDMTCAICLEQIQLENTAYVKGCEHAYCGTFSFAQLLLISVLHCTLHISEVTQVHLQVFVIAVTLAARLCILSLSGHADQTCTVLQPSASCSGLSCARTAAAHNARSLSAACLRIVLWMAP